MPRHPIYRAALLALSLGVALYLAVFAGHAWLMLRFAYPLDYGEGPLLTQAELLRNGTALWELYRDPTLTPYTVVNYPPLYLLGVVGLQPLVGSSLIAGRLISLLALLGCCAALGALLSRQRSGWAAGIVALSLLSVPIIREWALLMRVDLLGIALGLSALVILGDPLKTTRWRAGLCGALLGLGLLAKPSLIAASVAALLSLIAAGLSGPPRARRESRGHLLSLAIGLTIVGGGGVAFLTFYSAGWFAFHTVAANANAWRSELALGFWRDQLELRWPLFLGGALAALGGLRHGNWMAFGYILGGALVAVGVGKVGAYHNYFLELYIGLIWALGSWIAAPPRHWSAALPLLLLLSSFVTYRPYWSERELRPLGLQDPNPPRLIWGERDLWAEWQRHRVVLGALSRTDQALIAEIAAAGGPHLSDVPGIAAAAGVTARLQAFEMWQLAQQGLIDETALRIDLANGNIPLASSEFLGNWLSPEVIALLTHRYAQDGSRGRYDLWRPLDRGLRQPDIPAATFGALRLQGLWLTPPLRESHEPGDLLVVTLDLSRSAAITSATQLSPTVQLRLRSPQGRLITSSTLPLLYAALPLDAWPSDALIQHMQTLRLPHQLAGGRYRLSLIIGAGPEHELTRVAIARQGGQRFAETAEFVPSELRQAWLDAGGLRRLGFPLTPAVPFAWGRLQCFERGCLEWRAGRTALRPLGAWLYLGETARNPQCAGNPTGRCPQHLLGWNLYPESLGEPVSGVIVAGDRLMQWTEFSRVDYLPGRGKLELGRLGEAILRLPPGQRYRWPQGILPPSRSPVP